MSESENELQKSLVYFVSRRGAANYWASVINGMSKQFSNTDGTLSVALTTNHRYTLTVHLPFYEGLSSRMKLLVLVHEAAHVCLNHIPRLFKMLAACTDPFVRTAITSTFNWAADMAANDAIVRLEPGFEDMHKAIKSVTSNPSISSSNSPGEFPFILPEEFGFPKGKSMEEYMVLLLKDLPEFTQKMEQALKKFEKMLDEINESNNEGASDGAGESDGEGSPAKGSGRSSSRPGSVPGVPDAIIDKAMESPELFEKMQKAFDKLTNRAHKTWNKTAEEMTPEEAISAGNRMKKHAQHLVRSANERVQRDRGFLPGGVKKIIETLLEPEQIPWDSFLRDIIQGAISARIQEEMVSPNLSLINEDYLEPWPGQTLEFGFNITWMTDTSGSMGDDEYARACNCLNSLLAQNKFVSVTYVECDTVIQKETKVTNVEPPTPEHLEELRTRKGYGGTVYTPFFKRVAGVDTERDWLHGAVKLEDKHPSPDLIVVCTDGGVGLEGECFPQYRPTCPIIWLLMPGCSPAIGMNDVPPDRLIEMFKIREET